jgi:hypothetical protein
MSTDRDITRIVRSWLSTDEHESADRVLDAVLDRLDTTPQRRATWWPARRFPHVNQAMRIALASAAVVAVALIGFSVFSSQNVGGPGLGDPTPTPTPTPIPNLSGQQDLDAGTYRVGEPFRMDITISVPDGWNAFEDWAVNPPIGADPPAGSALGFWSVENLYVDPLTPGLGTLNPPVGSTVDDLVDALVSHPGWTTTEPTDVTVDGFAGKLVELTVPSDIEFDNCGSNPFRIWTRTNGGARCAQGPGQIHQIYVVDVEGERLVFYVISFPDTPAADLAALQAVVDSIDIVPQP